MPTPPHLNYIGLACISCLVAIAACHSGPAPKQRPVQDEPGRERTASREEELSMLRADSALFAAVVRTQLTAGDGDDDYPARIERLRYDSRPYGTRTGYPEVFAGVQGIDPTLTFARAGESAMDDLIDNRKEILQKSGVVFGAPVQYRQCAGVRVPAPPPPRRSTGAARAKPVDVHAGCPKELEYYVTVGLPIRGLPEGLKNSRDTRGRRLSLRGDVWTMLVDEHSASPKGWSWSQYAWLFRPDRSGRFDLVTTILIGVVE
jgi:hypothetical protein